jgi:hypothetical protein
MSWSDRWSGGALLVLALLVMYGAARLPLGGPSNPGPGFFPFWCGALLALLSLLLILGRVASDTIRDPPPGAALRLLAAFGVYAAVLDILGYLVATAGLLVVILRETRQSPVLVLVLATAVPIATYALFAKVLGVDLPKGFLPF